MIAHSFGGNSRAIRLALYVYDLDEAERQAKALFELLPKSAQVSVLGEGEPDSRVMRRLKNSRLPRRNCIAVGTEDCARSWFRA